MFTVIGKNSLFGEITIQGAKNAVLPMMAAALLTKEDVIIHNCPDIADVRDMMCILNCAGCETELKKNTLFIDSSGADRSDVLCENTCKIRSSVFMLGSLLGRFKSAAMYKPGGCAIGKRPIDIHLDGLKRLGITTKEEEGKIVCSADEITGNDVVLKYPSVGATENVIMAAATAKGITVIINAAKEPEIVDLCCFLRKLGAKIYGDGTQKIVVYGTEKLHGGEYRCMSDRIVSATYIASCAASRGELFLRGAKAADMTNFISMCEGMGITIKDYEYGVNVICRKRLKNKNIEIKTGPYPDFPTDMQPLAGALMCMGRGKAVLRENVFENRFTYLDELKKMGACVETDGRNAYIKGKTRLKGADVTAGDLRGGAAIVVAALGAEGVTTIGNCGVIKRGYENIVKTLRGVGAQISTD